VPNPTVPVDSPPAELPSSIDEAGCVASDSPADPPTRFQQRVTAELNLAELERALRRLARLVDPTPASRSAARLASRRSAWLPGD
jgi:hypothetical protein